MSKTSRKLPINEFEALTKVQLHELADNLLIEEPAAIEKCVEFIAAETEGLWHGRARAMMCRRLKHCPLSELQRDLLVVRITERLAAGHFAEQFRDQLRLAMHLDPSHTFKIARGCVTNSKPHVRRYAEWVLSHESSAIHA
jgi:hypothetical protein